ncbi:MAG: prenyltransferase/squalene oxidase repeat-containing protein [Candidatus Dormibacteria bacterium]|jgi:2-hydroxychromene-2-carboxylate isomerase/aspartokinase-like uncharacterized kinase
MSGSRRFTALAVAAVLVGGCTLLGAQRAQVVRAEEDPASRALAYLQTQQGTDGSIPEPGGGYADSELYAIAAAADGFDPNVLTAPSGTTSVMTYLAENAAGACADPGACGELIQAVVAAGGDPTSFGGQDLLTMLEAGYDPATGEYGDGEAFTQALAIQGLVAAGAPVPVAATQFLKSAQDSDGGWDYEDVRDDTTNPYDTSDTNSTSMVLMALDAAGDHGRDATALAWLVTQQDTDGGFPYQAGYGSDPDSTALVVQAIVATGGDPFAAAWTMGGVTPLGYLEETQDPDGGYTFPGNAAPDPFTTSQVPLALLLQPYPIHATFSTGFTPAQEDRSILDSLLYLQTQQGTDGSIPEPGGGYADSELYAIAAAADGFDPNVLTAPSGTTSVMTYLAENAAGACADPGACGELIQAVVAAGGDPTSFGGQDLLTMLEAGYDPATGEYGDGEAFTQALAIQGLVAAGAPVPVAATQFLKSAQDSDGGWDYEDVRDDTTNPYDTSDTNSTSMVLMALDAAGDHGRDATALAWLVTQQDTDGGFPYQAGYGSDPDSTALVVQAIVATGGDPFAAAWTMGGVTPLGYLEETQDPDGGYTFPGNAAPDPFTTSQVPLALERLAFPIPFGSRQWYLPGATLGTPPTATPTATPSPSPSSSPPAGVITPPPTPVPTSPPPPSPTPLTAGSPSPVSQVQAAASGPSPAAGGTPAPAPVTAPSPVAPASLHPSTPAAVGAAGGPPAPLIYALVALAVALVVGGARLAWAARR